MDIAYPNIDPDCSPPVFRACVRYASRAEAPGAPYKLARPNTRNGSAIREGVRRLAPAWSDVPLAVELYEKADVPGMYRGESQDLAYFLALIRCARRLVLEGLEAVGDLWCTGVVELAHHTPVFRQVEDLEFAAKLVGFLAQAPQDRIFLVPEANIFQAEYRLCRAQGVPVLTLEAFQQQLAAALQAGVWRDKVVVRVHYHQLPDLVEILFTRPSGLYGPVEPVLPARRPYRGLAAFDAGDADLFAGREQEIRQVLGLLPTTRLLVLHGASGTGKTSLLQAGVLPRLPSTHYAAVRVRVVDEAPTSAILRAIARQLEVAQWAQERALVEVLHTATTALHKTLVVVLDQFEEFFLRFPVAVRRQFHRDLGQCLDTPTLPVHFLLALREDYVAQLDEFRPSIPDPLARRVRLTRLTVGQATAAVVEPAQRLGLTVEAAFLTDILLPQLQDAEGTIEPPVLQLVCEALYDQAMATDAPALGMRAYQALGDVRTWMERYLTDTLRCFGPDQADARAILKALVTAAGTTKRAVDVEELTARLQTMGVACEAETLEAVVLPRLVQARLVRTDEAEGATRYELIHEFLVPPIAPWMTADDRTPLAALELIAQAYEGFKGTGLLLERAALQWIAPYADRLPLSPEQQAFLARSKKEATRQRRRLGRRVGAVVLAIVLVGGSVALWQLSQAKREAETQRQRAMEQAQQAQRRLVASYAEQGRQELLRGQPQRAAVYLSEAYQRGETRASLRVLLALALPRLGAQLASLEHKWPVSAVAFSADGTHLVTVHRQDATEHVAKVWQAGNGQFLFAIQDPPESVDDRLAAVVGRLTWVPTPFYRPDDTRLVTADEGGVMQVSRVPRKQLLPSLDGPLGPIAAYRNSTLAMARADGTVEVREMTLAGHLLTSFVVDPPGLSALTFSPDGAHLVVVRADGTVQLRDTFTAQLLTAFADPPGLSAAAFSPDGTRLATTSTAGTVQVWAMPGGQLLTALAGHPGPVHAAAFSPDGTRLVTTSAAGTVQVWAMPSGQLLTALAGHPGPVHAAAFSPDGTRLVTTSTAGTVQVWAMPSGQLLTALTGHTDWVYTAAFSPDGTRLVTVGQDMVKVWEAPRSQLLTSFQGPRGPAVSAAWSPEGVRVVTVRPDGTAHVWDAVRGQRLIALQEPAARVGFAALSPDGVRLVTTLGTSKTAQVWDAASGQLLTTLEGHTGWVYAAAFSPDGTWLVTASQDETVQVWDAAGGQPLTTLEGHTGWVYAAAFSPKNAHLITASWNGTVQMWGLQAMWDAASGQLLGSLKGHNKPVCAVAWSPDGARLVTASEDQTAKVWDIAREQPLTTLLGHTGPVCAVAWSPDGTRLVTASEDQTAKVWDAGSGQLLTTLLGHTGGVISAVFSPDPNGQRLVTTSRDGTANVWDVSLETRPPTEIAALVRCRVPWRLTAEGQLLQAAPDPLACPPLAEAR
ncbi:MAG TPA: AAA family ATPase [Candidatus Tectomicrobia bacterium]